MQKLNILEFAEWLDLEFLATNEADKSITSFRYKAKELSEGFQNALRGEYDGSLKKLSF